MVIVDPLWSLPFAGGFDVKSSQWLKIYFTFQCFQLGDLVDPCD